MRPTPGDARPRSAGLDSAANRALAVRRARPRRRSSQGFDDTPGRHSLKVPRAPQVATIGAPLPRRFPALVAGLLVAAVALLAWPFRTLPAASLDLSWEIGLHQAAAAGLRFGHDIVFTYGPLGFLAFPTPFVGPTSALAFVAMLLLVLAAAAVLVHESRRLFPLSVAIVVALVAARALAFILPLEVLQFIAFALGVELLRRGTGGRPDRIAV